MLENLFELNILNIHWSKNLDDPNDLCAHGYVFLKIGEKVLCSEKEGSWCVSAAALNLMRTITKDYKPGDFECQLIPCCGHFILKEENQDSVLIMGCSNGIDWTIKHLDENLVVHLLAEESLATVTKEAYKKTVFDFADQVEMFYKNSSPKNIPTDDPDRSGYLTFWKEWSRLRNS